MYFKGAYLKRVKKVNDTKQIAFFFTDKNISFPYLIATYLPTENYFQWDPTNEVKSTIITNQMKD